MSRYVITGCLGPAVPPPVALPANDVHVTVELLTPHGQLSLGLAQVLRDLRALGLRPTEVAVDLILLAALVQLADTRLSRRALSEDGWTRELCVVVPVSDPARWNGTATLLSRMLDFLTGDRWSVQFSPRPAGLPNLVTYPAPAAVLPVFDSVALFSGGLDSLIGAISTLAAGGSPLFVSHAGDGLTSASQEACFAGLHAHFAHRPLHRLRAWLSFPHGVARGIAPELTTRGRSFLFIALGVLAGSALGRPFLLDVPENGLIALNVPLDVLRLGALSTRTTHPFYLARWNELLAALQVDGQVKNPFWNKTKGEMVADCPEAGLLRVLTPKSMSCSSPTKVRWAGRRAQHCGYCFPCLIRRAALLFAWGAGNDATPYSVPILTQQPLNSRQAKGQQIRSLQVAIERLRATPSLAKLLIHKPGPLGDVAPAGLDVLADMYCRGMAEVATLLHGVVAGPE